MLQVILYTITYEVQVEAATKNRVFLLLQDRKYRQTPTNYSRSTVPWKIESVIFFVGVQCISFETVLKNYRIIDLQIFLGM